MFVLAKNIGLVLIYLTGVTIFFLSITGRVKYGLLFLIPLFPLQNIAEKLQQFPLGKDLNDVLLIAMIIGWVMYNNSHREPVFQKSPYNIILFLYFIFTYITLWRGSYFLGLPSPVNLADPRLQNWKNYIIL